MAGQVTFTPTEEDIVAGSRDWFHRALRQPRMKGAIYIAALAGIQDVLGSLNDALVSRHLVEELERFLADVPSLGPTAAARGAGVILGWQAARIAEDMSKVTGVWKAFLKRKTFWPRPIL